MLISSITQSLHSLLAVLSGRFTRARAGREAGSVTLEQVVIAAGLLAAAVGLVAIIVAAVNKYAGSIN
jgi:hypothetical protein